MVFASTGNDSVTLRTRVGRGCNFLDPTLPNAQVK